MAFLDFSKAFDTVWRDGLMYWQYVWQLIDNLYKTDFFKIDEGVKQGCVLSSVLFYIYIHQFTKLLNDHKLGVNVCNVRVGSLFWADDIVLIVDNEHDLQKMLDLAVDFAINWKLSFNHTKSNVLIIGKRINKDYLWHLGNIVLKKSYEHLV